MFHASRHFLNLMIHIAHFLVNLLFCSYLHKPNCILPSYPHTSSLFFLFNKSEISLSKKFERYSRGMSCALPCFKRADHESNTFTGIHIQLSPSLDLVLAIFNSCATLSLSIKYIT